MTDDVKLPTEWVVEVILPHKDDEWETSSSFYAWLNQDDDVLEITLASEPRTLDECIEFLSLPREEAKRVSVTDGGSYRIRNIRTDEIIPGEIFVLD